MIFRNATITTAVILCLNLLSVDVAKRSALWPSKATLPALRSLQLVFDRMVGMVTFSWIASPFHASQRQEWSDLAQRHNHHCRHGEARSAAAIQGSVDSTAERSVGTHHDGGYGCI